MDLLSQYESSEDNETCDVDDSPGADRVLKEIQPRTVYLITYSQADLRAIPTRQAFADVVLEAVKVTDASEVQWVCAQESHRAGRTERKSGVHFHMAIKLNKVKLWNTIRRYIKENWGINVHF